MPFSGDSMNEMIEIKKLLTQFQAAYTQRNTETVDEFIIESFGPGAEATIIGTGNNELCFDYTGIKKLFVGDWQHWGDLKLELDKSIIRLHGDSAWVHCPATVKYTFSDDPQTDERFVAMVKEFFDGKSIDSQKATKVKLAEINWMLAHYLHPREPKANRVYYWQLRVYFVMILCKSLWSIKHIQFSFPKNSIFADARICPNTYYERNYNQEIEQYQKYGMAEMLSAEELTWFSDFSAACLTKAAATDEDIGSLFTNEALMLNTNSEIDEGRDCIAHKFQMLKRYWDAIVLNKDSCAIDRWQNSVWLHTNGLFKKRIDAEDLFALTASDVQEICDCNRNAKEKLFLIRRNISNTFKEYTCGDEYIFPFRFEAFIIHKDGGMYFDYIQFSLPLDNILEQINDDF